MPVNGRAPDCTFVVPSTPPAAFGVVAAASDEAGFGLTTVFDAPRTPELGGVDAGGVELGGVDGGVDAGGVELGGVDGVVVVVVPVVVVVVVVVTGGM